MVFGHQDQRKEMDEQEDSRLGKFVHGTFHSVNFKKMCFTTTTVLVFTLIINIPEISNKILRVLLPNMPLVEAGEKLEIVVLLPVIYKFNKQYFF